MLGAIFRAIARRMPARRVPMGNRNRIMGPARRRNRPSKIFHVVYVSPSGRNYFLFSNPSLTRAREHAKKEAAVGKTVELMDQHMKLIRKYAPGDAARRAARPRRRGRR